MKAIVLFSGGKDSTFAVWYCAKHGIGVERLVTMQPESRESYMFHYPNIKWTRMQADSMGLRHEIHRTGGEKESEVQDMVKALKPLRREADYLACGGLASTYQADRVGKVAHMLGLKPLVPFWHVEPEKYWGMILSSGLDVMITGVSADGLGRDWLGRRIDSKSLESLKKASEKHRFHLGGEGGEYESMALDGPMFRKRLVPVEAETAWDESTGSGFYIINDMMAIDKDEAGKLMKDYLQKRDAIRKRLDDFRRAGSAAGEEGLFAELAFCLCTPQSRARSCWAAVESLKKKGILLEGGREAIEKNLKGVRFHRNKARYIEKARGLDMGKLRLMKPGEAREFLVDNVVGMGYKEASHFLRNIGMGHGIAILDRHILKNLHRLGVIDSVPKSVTKKNYMEIERRMSAFCSHSGITEEELDLLLWSKETGEIFK